MPFRILLLLSFLVGLSVRGAAQQPSLVTDLNPGAASASPFGLVVFQNQLCLAATTPGKGFELWNYNGGTQLSAAPELNAGSGDGVALLSYTPPAVLNGKLYFAGTNAGGAGLELYAYDGTGAPVLAADLNPGTAGSLPSGLTLFGNKLFFSAVTAASGYELYAYNGSVARRYDLMPGSGSSAPSNFAVFDGKLYFSAALPGSGAELCVYDPVADSVTLAADIVPGSLGSSIAGMAVVAGNGLYFTAITGARGRELWRYDGTGASLVSDLLPGNGSGQAADAWLATYGGNVYFSGTTDGSNYRLCCYDPVADSVREAAVIRPAGDFSFAWPYVFDNKLYFAANDGSNGTELWSYDGSAAAMAGDLNPGGADSEPAWLCRYGDRLLFSATSAATGRELYRLQGGTGVQNVAFKGSAAVAPNPAPGDAVLLLTLKEAQRCSLTLTDVSGKTVWQQAETLYRDGGHRIPLPVAGLPAGLYFYAVKTGGRLLAAGRLQKQ